MTTPKEIVPHTADEWYRYHMEKRLDQQDEVIAKIERDVGVIKESVTSLHVKVEGSKVGAAIVRWLLGITASAVAIFGALWGFFHGRPPV